MTEILEEFNNSFNFYDEFNKNNTEFIVIKVNVQKKKYQNGDIFYYVNYKSENSDKSTDPKKINPLLEMAEDYEDIYEGDIIYANELTSCLIKYLIMPYEEMKVIIGNTSPQRYKFNIMMSIKNFWD